MKSAMGEMEPVIVDVVASVAVVGEAGTEIGVASELPYRIGLFSTDAGDPAGAELHRDAAELLLPNPAPDPVRRLQYHHILHAILRQHLRRRYTCTRPFVSPKPLTSLRDKHSTAEIVRSLHSAFAEIHRKLYIYKIERRERERDGGDFNLRCQLRR